MVFIQESFEFLLKKFNEIKSKGFIKSTSIYKNNSGLLFEKLVGSSGGDFCFPDFEGIELKVIRSYYDASIDLFNLTPDSCHLYTTKWLTENFGYPDKDFKNSRVLKGNVYANKLSKIGLFFYFKTNINKNKKRIILEIYNSNKVIINNEIYWDFDEIAERIKLKINYLAIISVEKKYINNDLHFFYKDIQLYSFKTFDKFIKLLENGIIFITFKTGISKSGINVGKFHDHGTSFGINKSNLGQLFDVLK